MRYPLYMCGVLDIRFRWYLANFWPKNNFTYMCAVRSVAYRRSSPCSPRAVRAQTATPLPPPSSALPPPYCPVLHIPGDKSPSQPPYCPESHIPGDNGAPATPHAPCRHAGSRRAPRQQPRARYSVRSAVTGSFLAAMRLGASPARNESPTEISTSTAPAATGTEARFSTPVIW